MADGSIVIAWVVLMILVIVLVTVCFSLGYVFGQWAYYPPPCERKHRDET